jgi:hypothetical protein
MPRARSSARSSVVQTRGPTANIPCLTSDDYVTVGGGEPAPMSVTASHRDIEEIYDEARALLHDNGVEIQQRIGSGTYATVFAVARRRDVCIKLTLDVTEAAAVQTVIDAVAEAAARGHDLWDDLPALGRFYCVYALQLSNMPEGAAMYAITMDRYTRRPEPAVEEILDLRGRATEPDTLGQRSMEYICKKSRLPVHEDCTYGDARAYERVKAVLGPQLTRIEQTWKTLVGIGIEWFDLHSGNVMRDSEDNLRIIDLGRVWTTPHRVARVGGRRAERLLDSGVGISSQPVYSGITYRGDKGTIKVKATTKPGGTVLAHAGGTLVGALTWSNRRMQVSMVAVDRAYERRGIATALWKEAKRIAPALTHSDPDDQTEAGTAWAAKAERLPARKRVPVFDEAAWENFASSSEANQESRQTLGQRMEAVAWELGYEHASTQGRYAPYSNLEPFEPLARSQGVDLRVEYDAGFEAFGLAKER